MIPPYLHEATTSAAEKRVFTQLAGSPGTELWTCLHSLGLARHPRKRKAEIDFLLITNKAVLALEVKGGRVARVNGTWTYTDRYGVAHTSVEGPYRQASDAMFALQNEIRTHFGREHRIAKLLMGYGVMMPDVAFDANGPEEPANITYDARDRNKGICAYIERLTTFHMQRQTHEWASPTEADRDELAGFLRGDYEPLEKLAAHCSDVNEQLVTATREQYLVLDAASHRPRLLVEGGAGTGKTLLAFQCFRRAAMEKRRVGFIVFNTALAGALRAKAKAVGVNADGITTIYQLFWKLSTSSSFAREFNDRVRPLADGEQYGLMTEYARLALQESGDIFDELVLDEAQDYLSTRNLDVLDESLAGGLESGRWRVFLDSNNQAGVYGRFDSDARARLERAATVHVLTRNCRNTRPINDDTMMLTGPQARTVGAVNGVSVRYEFYSSMESQRRALRAAVEGLLRDGVAPGRITVLSPRQLPDSAITGSGIEFVPVGKADPAAILEGSFPSITAGTVSAFKGLENDAILLTDIDSISTEWSKATLYVGMTRARVMLTVLLSDSCRSEYSERAAQAAREKLLSDGGGV